MTSVFSHISVSLDGRVAGPRPTLQDPLGEGGMQRGWWGDDPPFKVPTFVVSHFPREALPMEGGTRFEFVVDGVAAAVSRARSAASDSGGRVVVAGGASVINQALNAGAIDELQLHVVPVVLGGGPRLFDGVSPEVAFEVTDTVAGEAVTHMTYRVDRRD
jgi:dihydrofolate reductase